MGQQQLLLVILVTIIVGIATVVAINTFGSAADSANVDAVRNDVASIGAALQGYYMRPSSMGGGGNSYANVSWSDVGGISCNDAGTGDDAAADDGTCTNGNGEYTLTGGDASQITIEGTPAQAGGTVSGTVTANGLDGNIEYTEATP